MAQRSEIEAWVNPSAWDDEAEAQRIVDAIVASGSDSEADWVRIAAGPQEAILDAASRDLDSAGQQWGDARRDYEAARRRLHEAAAAARRAGMQKKEIARRAGISRVTLDKVLDAAGVQ